MADITVDAKAFEAAMKARLAHVGEQTRAGVRGFGEAAKAAAVRHIHSVSGDLADRVVVLDHLENARPFLFVGVDESGDPDPHASDTEYGTVNEAPHPFIRPAVLEAGAEFRVEP